MGTAQHGGHILVRGGETLPAVHQEDDHIRHIDGKLGLPPHLGADDILLDRLDAPGIHQGKGMLQPSRLPVDAVPGNAGGILYDGDAFSDDPVKKGGFSNIGTAHHCHQRLCHGILAS